jgi:GTP-binding protein
MNDTDNQLIRNIAIIAHVDHGKTTLTDGLIKQTLSIRNIDSLGSLIMDSMDQEKERGITIKAKNASIYYDYKGKDKITGEYKINIVDTPGHADFGGEVERTLRMVDGVALLVDAQEGPMPQTKFVLKKAIELGHKVIVIINKVDKPAANCPRALSKVEDLFLDLGASDDQMDFPVVYASGVQGKAGGSPDKLEDDLFYFLDKVIEFIPAPKIDIYDQNVNTLQILVLALSFDNFKGKMGVGKITSGSIQKNQNLIAIQEKGEIKGKVSSLLVFDGLGMKEVESATAGEIVMVGGFDTIGIGDTISTPEFGKALVRVTVDEPTIQMTFGVNTSPFSGKEGKLCTSRQIRDRLYRELETNVALRVVDHPESSEKFIVSGRGELHLSVLIEAMRREGFELEVSRPQVIYHTSETGQKLEPFEIVEIDVPQEYQGTVMQELGQRSANITHIGPNDAGTEFHFEAVMPTRALIGLKSKLISDTRGTVVMHAIFDAYKPTLTLNLNKDHGSLISTETGATMAFALNNAQLRGTLFIGPAVEVYQGMVIGQCAKDEDLELNPCKGKQLSNVRSKSSDDAISLTPIRIMSLENCLEYINDHELVEVTPINLRIRKRFLDPNDRKRNK